MHFANILGLQVARQVRRIEVATSNFKNFSLKFSNFFFRYTNKQYVLNASAKMLVQNTIEFLYTETILKKNLPKFCLFIFIVS